ncbi:hypothetical protein [uncultured Maribacter sp.]
MINFLPVNFSGDSRQPAATAQNFEIDFLGDSRTPLNSTTK